MAGFNKFVPGLRPSLTGRRFRPYNHDPAILLPVILFAYSRGVTSSREIQWRLPTVRPQAEIEQYLDAITGRRNQ
ncbi:MAG: hypothetical protein L0J77_00050 [Marinobacter sp.]|nr:hypothetical protein [Marinobacter sp.]